MDLRWRALGYCSDHCYSFRSWFFLLIGIAVYLISSFLIIKMVFLECHSGEVCLIVFCGLRCQKLSKDQGRYLMDFFIFNICYDSIS